MLQNAALRMTQTGARTLFGGGPTSSTSLARGRETTLQLLCTFDHSIWLLRSKLDAKKSTGFTSRLDIPSNSKAGKLVWNRGSSVDAMSLQCIRVSDAPASKIWRRAALTSTAPFLDPHPPQRLLRKIF